MYDGRNMQFNMKSQNMQGLNMRISNQLISHPCLVCEQKHVILVMPTVPDIPPKLNTKAEALEEFRNKAFNLICVSGMSGCCQVRSYLSLSLSPCESPDLIVQHFVNISSHQ